MRPKIRACRFRLARYDVSGRLDRCNKLTALAQYLAKSVPVKRSFHARSQIDEEVMYLSGTRHRNRIERDAKCFSTEG